MQLGMVANPRHTTADRCRRTFRSEEFARDVESFASHYHDLLTVEQLLGHGAGQAAQEMSLAINDDLEGETSV